MARIRKYTSEHYYIAPTKKNTDQRIHKYSSSDATNNGGLAGGAGYLFSNLVAGGWGLFENTGRYFQGKFYDVTGNHKMAEYTFAKESFSEKIAREAAEEYNPGGGMQFAGAVSQGLGQSLVQMGISAIPAAGKGLSLGLIGSSSNAAAISNYVRTTGELDSVKAYGYGFTVSGIEVGLEALLGVGMKAGGGKLGTTFIGKLTGKTGTKSVGKAVAGVAKDAFEEGLEEAIAEIADPLLQRAWGMNPDATIDWGQVLYAGAVGAAAGGILSGAGTAIQTGTAYSRGKSIVANGTADVWTGAAQSAIGRYDSQHYNTKTGNETLISLKKELNAYNANPNKTGTNAMIQIGNIKRYTTALQVSNIVAEASRGFQKMDIKDAEVYASFLSGLVSGVKVNGAELLANKQLGNGMGAADLLAICWFGGAMRGDFERFQAELEAEAYNAQGKSLGINTEAGTETAGETAPTTEIAGENTEIAGENTEIAGEGTVQGVENVVENVVSAPAAEGKAANSMEGTDAGSTPAPAATEATEQTDSTPEAQTSATEAENAQEATEDGETVTEESAENARKEMSKRRRARKRATEEAEDSANVEEDSDTETEENATDDGESNNADETTEDTTEATTEDTVEDPAETEKGKREAGWYSAEVQDKARSMVRGFDMMHPDTRARILEMIASGKNVDKKILAALANVMAANFTLHVKFRNDMPTGGFRYRSDSGATMILLSTKATAEVLDHVVLEEVWHGVQGTKLAKDAETLLKRIAGEDAVAAEAKKYRDEFVKHFGEDAANKQLTEDALMDEAYANLFAKYGKEAQFLSRFARIAKGRFARVFGRIADLARTQKAKSELSYRQLMKLYRAYRKAVFSAGIYDIAAIRAVMQRMGDDEEEKENASDTGEANVHFSLQAAKEDTSVKYTPSTEVVTFVNSVLRMHDKSKISKRKKKLGTVSASHAEIIKKETGIDIAGFGIWIDGSAVQHISQRHGENGEADHSMADIQDYSQIAHVLNTAEEGTLLRKPDGTLDLDYSYRNFDRTPSKKLLLSKQIGENVFFVAECVPDTSARCVYVKSAYKTKKGSNGQALRMDETSLQPTSKTLDDYPATNHSILDPNAKVNPSAKKSSGKSSGANSMQGVDAEYLSAVERGDMETAQRMVDKAARKAGYTVKAWHGTPIKDITVFDYKKIGSTTDDGVFGRGFYFSTDKITAEQYSTADGKTMPVFLDIKEPWWGNRYHDITTVANLLNISEQSLTFRQSGISKKVVSPTIAQSAQFSSHLSEEGYDSVVVQHGAHNYEIVVFDHHKIKSADPVTYDDDGNVIPLSKRFDARNSDIRFSMAGINHNANREYDAEKAGIHAQIKHSQDILNRMEVVFSAEVPTKVGKPYEAGTWAIEQLKQYGFRADRQDFGTVYFDEKSIRDAMNYLDTDAERVSIAALYRVIKRGIQIGEHGNHKERNKHTITFAAPIELNGTRGNMAVVVNMRNNKYKVHRILLPDGSVFNFEATKKDVERESQRGVPKGSLADATSSTPNGSISQDYQKVNTSTKKSSGNNSMAGVVDNYTESQYNNFGWARDAGAISKNELDDLHSKLQERRNMRGLPRASDGSAIVEVNDKPNTTLGVDNVFVFVKGSVMAPKILRVVRFNASTETEMEILKEKLYERRAFIDTYLAYYEGKGFATQYRRENSPTFADYRARRSNGKASGGADRNHRESAERGGYSGSLGENGKDGVTRFSMQGTEPVTRMNDENMQDTESVTEYTVPAEEVAATQKPYSGWSKLLLVETVREMNPDAAAILQKVQLEIARRLVLKPVTKKNYVRYEIDADAVRDLTKEKAAKVAEQVRLEKEAAPRDYVADVSIAEWKEKDGGVTYATTTVQNAKIHQEGGFYTITGKSGKKYGKYAVTNPDVQVREIKEEQTSQERKPKGDTAKGNTAKESEIIALKAELSRDRIYTKAMIAVMADKIRRSNNLFNEANEKVIEQIFATLNTADEDAVSNAAEDVALLLIGTQFKGVRQSLIDRVADEVEASIQKYGKKTFKAKSEEQIEYLRKRVKELKKSANEAMENAHEYHSAYSDIVIKAHEFRNKYRSIKHSAGSMMGDPVMLQLIEQMGRMARGKYINGAAAQSVAELFKQFVTNHVNEVRAYVDVEGLMGDGEIGGVLDTIINSDGRYFTIDEIQAIDTMMKAIFNLYKNYNKVYYQSRHVELDKLAEDGIKQIDAGKAVFLTKDGKPSALLHTLRTLYPMITPTALTRMVEGFAKDGILSGYMQEIVNDADRATALRNEWMYQVDDYIAKHKGFKNKLAKTTVQFKGHEIPLGEAIHLYMLSKREQAAEALAVSAISYRDANGEKQVIKGMEFDSEADNASDVMAQAIKDMQALFSKLYNGFDADTKGFIRVLEQFYELAKAAKKATDIKYLGYTNVIDGYYVPILRAGIQRSAVESAAGLVTNEIQSMHNFRFNKATVKNRVPLELNDAYDLAANHANGVARYTCMYGSLTSFDRWYNFKVSGNEDIKSVSESAKDVLPQFNTYIRKLLSDVQGIRLTPETLDGFSSFIRGALTTSALGANIATPLKQHAGYFTAFPYITMKNLLRGGAYKALKTSMVIVDKQDLDEMMKYSPAAAVRYYKYEDSARARAEANLEKLGRIASKTTILIDRADMAMVMHLWSACKYQIQDDTGHGIDTEENHKLAGELLTKVINETQGTYSAATRTGLQRSRNEFAKAITMFSSDSAKQLTMIAESVFRVVYYRRANAEARKNGTEAPYSAEQIRKAIKDSARASSSVVISQIAFVLIGMLVNYGLFNKDYGEDEEENKAIALAKTFGKEFGLAMAGIVPVLDDILSFFLDGYEVSSPTFDAVNDVLNAFGGIFNVVSKGCSGDRVENHEWRRAIRDFIYAASGFVGIPARNTYNTFAGIWRRFSEYGKTAEKAFWYGTSSEDLNKAVASEDEEYAAKVVGLIAKNEQTGEMHKDVANELARLYVGQYVSSGQYRSVVRNVGDTYVDAEGNVTVFTVKERKKVQELYAKADGAVASLIATDQYAALDDDQKADAIGKIYDAYYRMAVAETVEGKAPYRRVCAYAMVENESIFFAALAYAEDLKSDAKYTKKQKLMQYLSAQDLSRYEKSVILWASGYDSEEVSSYIKSYLRKNGSEEEIAFAKQIGAISA